MGGLGIPRTPCSEQGKQGDAGKNGKNGANGKDGEQGKQVGAVSITDEGLNPVQRLDFSNHAYSTRAMHALVCMQH